MGRIIKGIAINVLQHTNTHTCEHTYVLAGRGQPDWEGCRWTDGEDELRKLLKGERQTPGITPVKLCLLLSS